MNFTGINFVDYEVAGVWAFAGTLVLAIIVLVILNGATRGKFKEGTPVFFGALFLGVILFTAGLSVDKNVKEDNWKSATENIKVKYDVKDARWDSKYSTADPAGSGKEGEILVTTTDGKDVVFQYDVNAQTSEPILKSLPERGDSPSNPVTPESLLRK